MGPRETSWDVLISDGDGSFSSSLRFFSCFSSR